MGFPTPLAVIATYGMVTIGAGHGALPAGLLLIGALTRFSGLKGFLLEAVVAGWLGVAILAPTLIPAIARRAKLLPPVGVAFLLFSVIGIVSESEAMPLTLATAVPFLVVSGVTLFRTWRRPAPDPRPGSDLVP